MAPSRAQRRSLTAVIAVIASGLLALVIPAAAFAHASQIGSTPLDGEVLTTAPTSVTVEFDSALLPMGAALVVRSEDDTAVSTAEAVVDDTTLTVSTDPAAAPGTYRVAYRAVSADGHTIKGSFEYVVEATTGADTEPTAAGDQPTPASDTSKPVSDASAPTEMAPAAGDQGAGPGLIIAIGAAIGVAILVAGIVSALLLRK